MKKNNYCLWVLLCLLVSCSGANKTDVKSENIEEISKDEIISSCILTEEQQQKLTPDDVLEALKEGNKDFTEDSLTVRNNCQRVKEAVSGQFPKAVVLSCLDSRVPVEDIFHQGIGDLFVARVAGNIVNEDILGSLEYGCKVSGSKIIVVLGHEYCGAIKSAIKDVKLGNITPLLSKIKPAIKETSATFKGEKVYSNPEYMDAVCKKNVLLTINEIRKKSPILKEMEGKGEIKIVGAMYDMESGKVDFWEEK